ncbi:hypothetical protein AAEK39_004958, partial [Escherichia coli]|nr:hypothetical protein [Escherichia coli]MCG0540385.1 hypothetical protein [Escherichia coli]MCO0145184.1 hypothetical protein [Escherichia coli]MEC6137875.1 hypothetical protein [Escherichia coli]MEC6271714.1 hypothetical protein [Escherichia coli]
QEAVARKALYQEALESINYKGDLYPDTSRLFGPNVNKDSKVAEQWKSILDANDGAYVSSSRLGSGAYQYNYNGSGDSDIISISQSLGGTARAQISRSPVGMFTGDGDDVIVVGGDYGRATSSGYTDRSNLTKMGNGDDTLIVGVSHVDRNLYLDNDGHIHATTKSQLVNDGELINLSQDFNDGNNGGMISGTTIYMDEGNDTVIVMGHSGNGIAIINSIIDLGAGDDVLQTYGEISSNNGTNVEILGGAGIDTLIIDSGDISSSQFSGIERIQLGNNGGVNIVASELIKDGVNSIEEGILKITGSSTSKVNLDGKWTLEESQHEGGIWNFGSIENDNAIKYKVYIHDDAPGIKLWIDENINVI